MDAVAAFWSRFLRSQVAKRLVEPRLYDTMTVGSSRDSADTGASLIVRGLKTATSSLDDDYSDAAMRPYVGALSVVQDGTGVPVAVVETTEVFVRRIVDLDAGFARDYGEWDGTAETLRAELRAYYGGDERLLVCERFRVVYAERDGTETAPETEP